MPTFIKAGYWEKLAKGFKGYLNLDDLIRSIVPSYQTLFTTATKTLVADGGTDETTTISSSEFTPPLTSKPRIVQVYDSGGNLIDGLAISYTLNGTVYDVVIGGDIDGHTNAIINVIS